MLSYTPSTDVPLRQKITDGKDESVLFMTDILSSPHRRAFLDRDPFAFTKCSRALPIADDQDIVVLSGSLDVEYYDWLRSLSLGPGRVVSYGQGASSEGQLADLVIRDPAPVREALEASGRSAVQVPFYCGQRDIECAELLGVGVLGCPEDITLRYFDKASFKEECRQLGIQLIEGATHDIDPRGPLNYEGLAELVRRLLTNYGKVIVRGTVGAAGLSNFTVDSPEIRELYQKIVENRDRRVLIEPFLNVISSPNDQWIIGRNGEFSHLGLTAQLFQGLAHRGNLYGQYYSKRIATQIEEISRLIVERMTRVGYIGIVGIDYIVTDQGIFPIENNARMNGSTFTHAIADKVARNRGEPLCWKFFKALTSPCSFNVLRSRLGSLLYDGSQDNFVFPYDTDQLERTGTFAVTLFAEDLFHLDYLQNALSYCGIESD